MEYGFSGYIAEPTTYNGLGLLLIDAEHERHMLCCRLAQLGAMALAIDINQEQSRLQGSTHIANALTSLYRYNAKLALITFGRSNVYLPDIFAIYPDIDILCTFDPDQTVQKEKIPDATEQYLFIKKHTEDLYKDFASYDKRILYTPEEYTILDRPMTHVMDTNTLWSAIVTIVQYA